LLTNGKLKFPSRNLETLMQTSEGKNIPIYESDITVNTKILIRQYFKI
jgi:hypothetical protein